MITFEGHEFQEFSLELSEREIYNDIRAECDISEILELRPDATPEFMKTFSMRITQRIPPSTYHANGWPNYSVGVFHFTAPSGVVAPHFIDVRVDYATVPPVSGWTQETCEGYNGEYSDGMCYLRPSINHYATSLYGDVAFAYVRNNYGVHGRPSVPVDVTMVADYVALDPSQRFVKLRSLDETSIAKYGRRVMDLVWPLGQHPSTMQGIMEGYLERHKEPVVVANMTVLGENDTILETVLSLRINDRIEITHPDIEMQEQFFVNSIDIRHPLKGFLEGSFALEQVRDMEKLLFFTLDESELDGEHVLAS